MYMYILNLDLIVKATVEIITKYLVFFCRQEEEKNDFKKKIKKIKNNLIT